LESDTEGKQHVECFALLSTYCAVSK